MRALEIPSPYFQAGPRGVELALVRRALPWLAVIVPVALAASWAFRGVDGLISAAIGAAIGVANLVLAAYLLEIGARHGKNGLLAAALGGFAGRMLLITAILWGFTKVAFVDIAVLGFVLVGTHVILLTIEALTLSAAERTERDEMILKVSRSKIDTAGAAEEE